MAQRGFYLEQWNIQSFTHPDQEPYKVSQRGDGGFECSCKVWIFNRRWLHQGQLIPKDDRDYIDYTPDGHCKHIQFVIENEMNADAARTLREQGRPVVIQNAEFRAELVLNGRIKGFVDRL